MSVTQGRKATRLAPWAAALAVASALAVGTPVSVSAAASDVEFDLRLGKLAHSLSTWWAQATSASCENSRTGAATWYGCYLPVRGSP